MAANHYDLDLEQLEQKATGRLLMAETFDLPSFEALYDHIAAKSHDLCHEYVLSKQILRCIRRAISSINSQSKYVPGTFDNINIANKFELLLDMLIYSETPQDRMPGTPRII
jgi:hypothetical protein